MKQLKKTILTLVALLAVTAGAWADGIVCTASDLGKVLCTDGSIYENVSAATNAGKTAVAMIAYVDETNKNGLAIGLSDEGKMDWSTAKSTCEGKTAVSGVEWLLPSVEQWRAMFKAFGGNERNYNGLNTAITTAGGAAFQGLLYYWSSTEESDENAYNVYLVEGSGGAEWYEDRKASYSLVRACLAFDIAAASGPEVAWDKAEKTGSFTMPGGNVELEPEYYPQAALTAEPTAINDVPATTDGAIVNAGTVANIGETTTAQGTVMYYAVQSATAPTAPDYDATGWTDKVPTATDFAEGNVYVWYYVKGADGDETSTFNDGAITKLGESGYITLLAAPTYAVTFAEGVNPEPPAEPEWTAEPATDVTKGQTVTVTYTGSKKVIGVKATSDATPAEEPVTLATPLTIEALTAGTIVIQSPKVGMQYSLNGGTKTAATTDDINLAVQAGDKVQFYGNGTEISNYNDTRILGTGTGFTCKVYGNIMSLIDETGFATNKTLTSNNVFKQLFYANDALKDASGLLLPAETLTSSCYYSMFQICTNLVTGPDLPATTLKNDCYRQMFFGCSSLTAAPDLPATLLSSYCYYGMFNGCSSLTAAPDLPAPALVSNCYRQMFQNCSKLASVKCLATSPGNATNSWLNGAGSQVTGDKYFYAVSTASWTENSDSGIPVGWTRVNIDN